MSRAKPVKQEIRVNPKPVREYAIRAANDEVLERVRALLAAEPIYELFVPDHLQDGDDLQLTVSVPFVVGVGGRDIDVDVMPIGVFILLGQNPNTTHRNPHRTRP